MTKRALTGSVNPGRTSPPSRVSASESVVNRSGATGLVGLVAVVTAIRQNSAEARERTALKEKLRDEEED